MNTLLHYIYTLHEKIPGYWSFCSLISGLQPQRSVSLPHDAWLDIVLVAVLSYMIFYTSLHQQWLYHYQGDLKFIQSWTKVVVLIFVHVCLLCVTLYLKQFGKVELRKLGRKEVLSKSSIAFCHPSSKLCHNWLCHWIVTPYLHMP